MEAWLRGLTRKEERRLEDSRFSRRRASTRLRYVSFSLLIFFSLTQRKTNSLAELCFFFLFCPFSERSVASNRGTLTQTSLRSTGLPSEPFSARHLLPSSPTGAIRSSSSRSTSSISFLFLPASIQQRRSLVSSFHPSSSSLERLPFERRRKHSQRDEPPSHAFSSSLRRRSATAAAAAATSLQSSRQRSRSSLRVLLRSASPTLPFPSSLEPEKHLPRPLRTILRRPRRLSNPPADRLRSLRPIDRHSSTRRGRDSTVPTHPSTGCQPPQHASSQLDEPSGDGQEGGRRCQGGDETRGRGDLETSSTTRRRIHRRWTRHPSSSSVDVHFFQPSPSGSSLLDR